MEREISVDYSAGFISKANFKKLQKQAEAEVVPSSSSVKSKLSLVKLLLEKKLSFSSDF